MGSRQRRYSLEPIELLLAHDQEVARVMQFVSVEMEEGRVPPVILAKRLGVDRNSIYRWRKDGIPEWSADKAAITMGYHPSMIWPEYLESYA